MRQRVSFSTLLFVPIIIFFANLFIFGECFLLYKLWTNQRFSAQDLDKLKTGNFHYLVFNPVFGFLNFEKREEIIFDNYVVVADSRPLIIKKYLTSFDSPLLPYADLIFKTSQDYGLDYRLLLAIAQQESNLCKKIPEDSYNCWGWGIHSRGTLRFSSYEEAILAVAKGLKEDYLDKGLKTPEEIMTKYTPLSDGSWAFGVRQFMEEMEYGQW